MVGIKFKNIIKRLLTITKRLLMIVGLISLVALVLYVNSANIYDWMIRNKCTQVMDKVFLVPDEELISLDMRIACRYKKFVYLSKDAYQELENNSLLGKFILAHEKGHTFQPSKAWYDDVDEIVEFQREVEADIYACRELNISEPEYLDIRLNKMPYMMAVIEDRLFDNDDEDPFVLYFAPEYLSQYEKQAEQVIQAVFR